MWELEALADLFERLSQFSRLVLYDRRATVAGPRDVLVSRTVKDSTAGSGFSFADRGEHELKGVPERWQIYRVRA